jgi:predicted Zn-dependent protease
MDRDGREELARRALSFAPSGQVEVLVLDGDRALTRFTHNAIHQNLADRSTTVRFRIVRDGKSGMASTSARDDASLREAANRAASLAEHAPFDRIYPGLPKPRPLPPAPDRAYVPATAEASPDARAAIAKHIFETAQTAGLWAAGFVETSRTGLTVANSNGVLASFEGTDCGANVKQNGVEASGFAERFDTDVATLDGTRLGSIAAAKAVHAGTPQPVEPGPWTVVFEPAAFGELLAYLLDHFSARSYDEGSSFISGVHGLGHRYVGENITLMDDYANPYAPGMPFDYEGAPKKRVRLFERGVATHVVTDAYWGKKVGYENTGHAPLVPGGGPMPQNAVLEPGPKPLEQLIAETERGLLVTRLWYIRPVDRRKTIVTGMTRDGTFLIEKGKITRGVRNMRFNQSILEMLGEAEIASGPARTASFNYSLVTPGAKVPEFQFTSTTDF